MVTYFIILILIVLMTMESFRLAVFVWEDSFDVFFNIQNFQNTNLKSNYRWTKSKGPNQYLVFCKYLRGGCS